MAGDQLLSGLSMWWLLIRAYGAGESNHLEGKEFQPQLIDKAPRGPFDTDDYWTTCTGQ